MTEDNDNTSSDTDAYYGNDDDTSTEELDLSFLDEDESPDEKNKA